MSRLDLGPKPHLGYTESRLARVAERRRDAVAAAAMSADANAGVYLMGGEMIVLKQDTPCEALFTFEEARALAPIVETVFLGLDDGAPQFEQKR